MFSNRSTEEIDQIILAIQDGGGNIDTKNEHGKSPLDLAISR